MTENGSQTNDINNLRERAQTILKNEALRFSELPPDKLRKLFHELRTYQIELELQNKDLRRVQEELKNSRDRFSTLYDIAPVGYLTLDRKGIIVEANLTAAELLGRERNALIGRFFTAHVARNSQDEFYFAHRKIYEAVGKQEYELELVKKDGSTFPTLIEALAIPDKTGEHDHIEIAVIDISKRAEALRATRESEMRFRTLAGNIPGVVYRSALRAPWPVQFISEAILKLSGFPARDFLEEGKRNYGDLIHPDDIESVKQAVDESIAENRSYKIEYRICHADGSIRQVYERGRAVFDENGEPLWLDGVVIDVSERKKKEQELYLKNSAIESAINGIGIADSSGTLVYVNDSCVNMWGYENKDELLGRKLPEFWDEERIFRTLETLREQGWDEGEDMGKRKDGSLFPLHFRAAAVGSTSGEPQYYVGSFFDISEQKQSENALRASEERYRTLVETSPEAITLTDLEGQILAANQQTLRLHGFDSLDQLRSEGWNAFAFIAKHDKERALENTRRVLEEGVIRDVQYSLLRRDGSSFPGELSAGVVTDEQGQPRALMALTRDITGRKKIEEVHRERERLLRTIAENYPNSFLFIINKDLTIGYSAGQEFKKQGLNPDDFTGRSVKQIFGSYTDEVSLKIKEKCLETFKDKETSFELQLDDQHQSYKTVPLPDEGGQVDRILIVVENITKRKKEARERVWKSQIDQALAALAQALVASNISFQTISEMVLDSAKTLTRCEHGYVGVIDEPTGDLVVYTLTKMMGESCNVKGMDRRVRFLIGVDGRYPHLWGHALNTKKGFYTNAPADHEQATGTPMGHVPLQNLLSVPVLLGGKLVGQISLANTEGGFTEQQLEAIERLAHFCALALDRKKSDETREKATHDLGERIKELNCLYSIAHLVETPDISLDDILQGTVDLIPSSWQYPEITCGRIILEGKAYKTKPPGKGGWKRVMALVKNSWKQSADIKVYGERKGMVEVYYLEERPELDEGPFLKEERSLINGMAEYLGRVIQQKQTEARLARYREDLENQIAVRTKALKLNYEFKKVLAAILSSSLEEQSLDDFLETTLDYLLSIPVFSFKKQGEIFLVEDESETLVMKAWKNIEAPTRKICARVPFGQCLCGKAAASQEIEFSDTLDSRHKRNHKSTESHGHYCVPIVSDGRTLGVITIYLKEGHSRGPAEEEFLTTIATTLAGIIRRKQMETENLKLSNAVQQTTDMLFITNHEGIIEFVNPAFWEVTGYSAGESIGKTPSILKSGKMSPEYYQVVWEAILNGESVSATVVNKKKNGELFHYDQTIAPVKNSAGTLTHFISTGKDITKRIRADEELKATKESLEKAQEIAHFGNWDWDIVSNTLFWSDEVYRIFGLMPQEFDASYEAFVNTIHSEDRKLVTRAMDDAVNRKGGYDIEYRIVRPDGTIRSVHEQAETIVDENNEAARMIGTCHDITERKEAEEKIKILSKFPSENPNPIMRATRDGIIAYANESSSSLLKTWKCGVGQPLPDYWQKVLHEAFDTGSNSVVEHEVGERVFSFLLSLGATNQFVYIYANDITERKKAEEKQLELDKAKSDFIMLVAHEIATPLTVASGRIELLGMKLESQGINVSDTLERVTTSLDRISRLKKALDDMTLFEQEHIKLTREHILIPYLCKIAAEDLEPQAREKNIELLSSMNSLPTVVGDRDRLYYVVTTLLSNAIRYTPKGGQVEITGREAEENIELMVKDNGIGLVKEDLEKVFERFYQVKDIQAHKDGFGLGLSLAKGIVEGHGGRIWVESEGLGRGCTFHFTLPKNH